MQVVGQHGKNHYSMSNLTNEDKSLFAEAVKDVTKLKKNRHQVATPPTKCPPKASAKKQLNHFEDDLAHFGNHPSHHSEGATSVDAHQKLSFKRPQLDTKSFKRLQKGLFQTFWQLDLHGLTEVVADQQLHAFIHDALAEKARYLIIIHGKGYNSDTDTPILKNLVNQRLRQIPQVLGFCSAQPKDGGTGAAYVFLQKQLP